MVVAFYAACPGEQRRTIIGEATIRRALLRVIERERRWEHEVVLDLVLSWTSVGSYCISRFMIAFWVGGYLE